MLTVSDTLLAISRVYNTNKGIFLEAQKDPNLVSFLVGKVLVETRGSGDTKVITNIIKILVESEPVNISTVYIEDFPGLNKVIHDLQHVLSSLPNNVDVKFSQLYKNPARIFNVISISNGKIRMYMDGVLLDPKLYSMENDEYKHCNNSLCDCGIIIKNST